MKIKIVLAIFLFQICFINISTAAVKDMCKDCHPDKSEMFSRSIHKDFDCTMCHLIKKLPHYRVAPVKCEACHAEIKALYDKSVHGRGRLISGLAVAPNCNDCHDAHNVKLHTNPRSITYKTNIPYICGKCHVGILKDYRESIHGKALLRNKSTDAPACTDCHGVHIIEEPSNNTAKTFSKNIPGTCAKCHAVGILMTKYGIKADQVQEYRESFHGKANIYGRLQSAVCSSCHGIHNIKAMNDPLSQVSKKNLPKTCGKCHKEALSNPNFSKVIMHLDPTEKSEPIAYYIRIIYLFLIVLTIGGMALYNILDLIKRRRKK